MKTHDFKKLKIILLVFALTSFLTIVLDAVGAFAYLELKSYDDKMRRTAEYFKASDDIAIIVIDQESLDWAKTELGWSWPWPRKAYGDMVRFFTRGAAKTVSFDMLYTEPSVYGDADDQAFAAAIKSSGRVALALHFVGDKAVYPTPIIKNAAPFFASVISTSDSDGFIRRARYASEYGSECFASLGLAPLVMDGSISPEELPDLAKKTLALRFTASIDDYVPYRASQILRSEYCLEKGLSLDTDMIEPENFSDTAVFVGVYAPGLYDICSTPISQTYPGVAIHLNLLDTVLNGNEIKTLSYSWTILLILLFAFLAAVLVDTTEKVRFRLPFIIIAFLGFGILYTFGNYAAFAFNRNLPLVPVLFAYFLSFLASLVQAYFTEGRQRRYLKTAFSQYLSPAVIQNLISDPSKLKLGGEKRELTIYFSDIQGFTSISETLSPETLTAFLNTYLGEMTDIIMKSGGTIDKYEGDAIIAFWNAPLDVSNHSRVGLETAIACQERLALMQEKLQAICHKPVYHRIGINTGDAVVGNMGSSARFDYTMFGDAVNLASRLEGLNKQFGTYTMCSKAARDRAIEEGTTLKFRELARANVVGKKEAVVIYEPMTAETYAVKKDVLDAFDKALHLFYEAKIAEALAAFESIGEKDPPAMHYAQKCRTLLESGTVKGFKGTWQATEK